MKRVFLFLLVLFCSFANLQIGGLAMLNATTVTPVLKVHLSSGDSAQFALTDIDSLAFSAAEDYLYVNYSGDKQKSYATSDIASLTYGFVAEASDISIVWNTDGTVSITNPMAAYGVSITATGQDVLIQSTYPDEVNYNLSGTSSDGSLKIYSDYKYQLTLMGLSLTNPTGAAINFRRARRKGLSRSKTVTRIP